MTALTGSGGLTKTGGGALFLLANNTYTGGTTVNGGILHIGAEGGPSGSIVGTATVTATTAIWRSCRPARPATSSSPSMAGPGTSSATDGRQRHHHRELGFDMVRRNKTAAAGRRASSSMPAVPSTYPRWRDLRDDGGVDRGRRFVPAGQQAAHRRRQQPLDHGEARRCRWRPGTAAPGGSLVKVGTDADPHRYQHLHGHHRRQRQQAGGERQPRQRGDAGQRQHDRRQRHDRRPGVRRRHGVAGQLDRHAERQRQLGAERRHLRRRGQCRRSERPHQRHRHRRPSRAPPCRCWPSRAATPPGPPTRS